MKKLGKMERVELRVAWEDEAQNFTPWLAQAENLRLLGEALGMDLVLEGTERPVGAYHADILAKDSDTNGNVIIENQLEKTNHDHLGKLITYASGFDALAVVWIAREFSDEHRRALDWLNDRAGEKVAFFGVQVELWSVDGSAPAPKFNVVSRPNSWVQDLANTFRDVSGAKALQLEFWGAFIEYAKSKSSFLKFRKPRPQHWYNIGIGWSGGHVTLTVHTKERNVYCGFYIPRSKQAFAALKEKKKDIEQKLGSGVEWDDMPNRKASWFGEGRTGDIKERSEWPALFAWLKERAEAYHRVLAPLVHELDVEDEGDDNEDPDNSGR